jgi:hypothetical protein
MRALRVVVCEPVVAQPLYLRDRREQIGIKHFFAVGAVKAFDEGILIRLARLDVVQRDVLALAPGGEFLGGELGSVVPAEYVRGWP